jgi:hypothetical protein
LQSVTVIFDANPVNVVAQTVVKMGAYTVSQLPVAEMLVEAFVLTFRNGAPDEGSNCTGGDAHQVISGTYDVRTWLCEVTSIGAASGEGNTML